MTDEKQEAPTTTLPYFLANVGAFLPDCIKLMRTAAEATMEREPKLRGRANNRKVD